MKNTIQNITKTILYLQITAMMFVTTALAGPGAADKAVPFKGRLEGSFTVTPLEPPLARVFIEATGNATHLGRFTVEVPHLVSFATTSGAGSYEFTAANGDTLTADFTGVATPTPDGLFIVEIATITGGTGRFDGATGSFTVIRLADLATSFTSGSFDGTIVIHKTK